jgi:hypothetical protein
MKKINLLMGIPLALAASIYPYSQISSTILAQNPPSDPAQMLDPSDQPIEPNIQILPDEQSQEAAEEQDEQNLERTLNIEQRKPNATKVEDIPAPGVGNNVPTPPPLGEIEVDFPK